MQRARGQAGGARWRAAAAKAESTRREPLPAEQRSPPRNRVGHARPKRRHCREARRSGRGRRQRAGEALAEGDSGVDIDLEIYMFI